MAKSELWKSNLAPADKSKAVIPHGDGDPPVRGVLTIHGVTKEVLSELEGLPPKRKNPYLKYQDWGYQQGQANEFGLTWSAALETGGILVCDDLKIDLEAFD